MVSLTVSSAFKQLLQSLCLKDFPCGTGSWTRKAGQRGENDNPKDLTTEDQQHLLELLNCPLSPWRLEATWSPQALDLRELCIKAPDLLNDSFIYQYFKVLRIVDMGISTVDDGVLRFSRLEELVLSSNHIFDLSSMDLPSCITVLELYGNQVSSLRGLCARPLPQLQHLGLGSNKLGSPNDIPLLTSHYWPQLVSLDLSWSEFVNQRALFTSLATLPRLRALVLEGTPLTLSIAYPGFAVDSLPRLLYLDGRRISAEERDRFKGLAQQKGVAVDRATVTVCVHSTKGVPEPCSCVSSQAATNPLVSHTYRLTYDFITPSPTGSTTVHTYSTPSLAWAHVMEHNHTFTHEVEDLGALKNVFLRELVVTVEEEKILSWPVSQAEMIGTKFTVDKKVETTEIKKKMKKKESLIELVQDPPIRRALGTVPVELRSLMSGHDSLNWVGNLDTVTVCTEPNIRRLVSREKEAKNKVEGDMKKDDRNTKSGQENKVVRGNAGSVKSRNRDRRESDINVEQNGPVSTEPLTVELTIHLNRWQTALQDHRPQHN